MGTAGTVMNKSSSHLRLTVAFCLSVEIYWPTSYTAAPSWMDAAHLQRQRAMGFGHQPTWEKLQLLFCWLFSLSFFLFFWVFFFFLSWFIWTFFFFFTWRNMSWYISNIAVLQKREKNLSAVFCLPKAASQEMPPWDVKSRANSSRGERQNLTSTLQISKASNEHGPVMLSDSLRRLTGFVQGKLIFVLFWGLQNGKRGF